MNLFSKINDRLLRKVRSQRSVTSVEGDAVMVTQPSGEFVKLPLSTLVSALVHQRDIYSHDEIVLTMTFESSAQAEMFIDDPSWPALVEALDRSGKIAVPSPTWQLQAIANRPDAPPIVLLES